MENQPVEVAIAILLYQDKILLQLRDNIPTIVHPGYWGMFGGHLEPNENPDETILRELGEEIGYVPPKMTIFRTFPSPEVIRHIYYGDVECEFNQLILGEGWDMGLWTPEDIKKGELYSEKAGEVRPLGAIHQRIIMEFIQNRSQKPGF
ncbi:MAG TPA: NUDIX domain-containing protein [Oscillatoriaceae cyanobacterium M33_DOE_052]|uniref:NUDIX domain-containing protein n=1 Tax=Planktothricoides sp. SpSt-374 TaxID=2282167 RepID=A0A7C3VH18_9CYAN|nr:NUDIX domain-containing protein [Oscillatoriaceae cyanobacterium M33_DOE_052]